MILCNYLRVERWPAFLKSHNLSIWHFTRKLFRSDSDLQAVSPRTLAITAALTAHSTLKGCCTIKRYIESQLYVKFATKNDNSASNCQNLENRKCKQSDLFSVI